MKHISECLEEGMREWFEERAGIMEHCGGIPRQKAEALARAEMESWRKAREVARMDSEVQK